MNSNDVSVSSNEMNMGSYLSQNLSEIRETQ